MRACLRKVRFSILSLLLLSLSIDGFQPTSLLTQKNIVVNQQQWDSTPPLTTSAKKDDRNTKSTMSSTSLEAAPAAGLAAAAGSPLGSFLVLAGIILIHECGHYFAARGFNITVDEFSIGFGPKLIGFEALGNDFSFRALPLGGYVKFPENYNATLVQEQEQMYFDQQRELKEIAKEQQQDATTTSASTGMNNEDSNGVGFQIMNALSLGTLGRKRKEEQDEKIKELLKQEEEEQRKKNKRFPLFNFMNNNKKKDDAVNKPVELLPSPDNIEIDYYDDPNLLQNRPWFQRAVVLSGGVVFNLLLAFTIYFGEINTIGMTQPQFASGAIIQEAPAKTSPSYNILNKGDVIVKVNGRDITMLPESSSENVRITPLMAQKSITEFISVIRNTPDGDDLRLLVAKANSKNGQLTDIVIKPQRMNGSPTGPQSLGIILSPNFQQMQTVKSSSIADGFNLASKQLYETTSETAGGIISLFGQMIASNGNSNNVGGQVSGPIGLIRTGSDVVKTQDLNTILLFAAAISINLGVVNALPIPALDGGQLVFVLAEAVTGRKVDQRLQEGLTSVAILFLLLVSVSTTVGDVQSIFTGTR